MHRLSIFNIFLKRGTSYLSIGFLPDYFKNYASIQIMLKHPWEHKISNLFLAVWKFTAMRCKINSLILLYFPISFQSAHGPVATNYSLILGESDLKCVNPSEMQPEGHTKTVHYIFYTR